MTVTVSVHMHKILSTISCLHIKRRTKTATEAAIAGVKNVDLLDAVEVLGSVTGGGGPPERIVANNEDGMSQL